MIDELTLQRLVKAGKISQSTAKALNASLDTYLYLVQLPTYPGGAALTGEAFRKLGSYSVYPDSRPITADSAARLGLPFLGSLDIQP